MRKAELKDLNQIKEIVEDAKIALKNDGVDQWQNGTPDLFLLGRQISKESSYVIEDEKILAYAYLSVDFEPTYGSVRKQMSANDYYTIHTFCVNKDSKGSGIGSRFLSEIIEFARENNKEAVYIDTHQDNFKMRGLIEKMGFEYLGIIYVNDNGPTKERLAYELKL